MTLAKHLVLAQVLRDWQAEGQSFAGAGQIARNDIFTVVDRIERVLLHWEQIHNSSLNELLGGLLGNFGVVFELSVLDLDLFHIL